MKKTIAITGGHHNSALAVARRLRDKKIEIIWLGHRYTSMKDKNDSAEYVEVTESGFEFFDLKAGKFESRSPTQLLRFPLGVIRARSILKSRNVDVVFSFGSYLGATTALASSTLGIPVFIHEQTSVIGKANKFASRFATFIFLTWSHSEKYFNKSKSRVVGLPLRDTILESKLIKLFANNKKTILVLGGKQGSHFINSLVLDNIRALLEDYNIIIQTGNSSVTNDLIKAVNIKESLPNVLSNSFQVHGYISEADIGTLINSSDLVLSRSGAHTVYELALLEKKCVLIPFAHTHMKEQFANAAILGRTGQATLLPQSRANLSTLTPTLSTMLKRQSFARTLVPRDAAEAITNHILDYLKNE